MVRAVYFYNSSKHLTKQGSLEYDSGTGKYAYSSTAAAINQGDVGVTQIVVALPSGTFSSGMPLITFRTPKGYTSNALAMSTASWVIIEDSVETMYQVFYITMTINAWTYTAGRCSIMAGYLQSATFNALDLAFYTVADGVNNYEELDGDTYEQIYEALYNVFSDLQERVTTLEGTVAVNEETIAQIIAGTQPLTQITLYNANGNAVLYIDDDGVVRGDYAGISHELGENLFVRGEESGIILNGNAIMYAGSIGSSGKMLVQAITSSNVATLIANPHYFLGVATQDFTGNQNRLNWYGGVDSLDTTAYPSNATYPAGAGKVIYVDMVNGGLTYIKPAKPLPVIEVGVVNTYHATQGRILVRPSFYQSLSSLYDVNITSVANKDVLSYDSATQTWINRTTNEMDLPTLSGNNDFSGFNKFDKNIDMNFNKIINVGNGSNNGDAINYKQAIDWLALKADLVGGLVPSSQLPSYVDDVIEVATYADLPTTGEAGKIYVVIADETSGGNTSTYRWGTSVYVQITDTLSASEIKTLYESNADTNVFTDAEKAKLATLLSGNNYYTKAEVNALLESLKLIQGVEETALGTINSSTPIALSSLTQYDLIIAESIIDLAATTTNQANTLIFKPSDVFVNDNDYILFATDTFGNATLQYDLATGNVEYSETYSNGIGSCILKGIKFIDGTVHDEMRSVGEETITYRDDGKVSQVVADTVTTTPTYDEYGNITKITEVYALDGKTYETTFTYDKFGRISATNKGEV